MDYSARLNISYYQTIAVINEAHKVYLVQHQETKKIYIKKILEVYNFSIYDYLQHNKISGIPQVIDLYEEDGRLTVIEQFISGASLQDIMASGELSAAALTEYMCELCDILEKLHSLNPPVIHRDIKPSNIIVTCYDHVMLIDFNAAKYLTDANVSDTVLLGTKGYAAPEQYGFGSSTPQTDIYALGILLKELVSALPVPTEKFDRIIQKCTRINPADRFESAAGLKQEIQKLNGDPAAVHSEPFLRRALLPPGYRTFTPWKMVVSSIVYLFVFWFCLSIEFKNVFGSQLWMERIFFLGIALSVVFCSFNYCGIQRFLPLCKNSNRIVRGIGVVLLDLIIAVLIFVVMLVLESILFP